MHLEAPLQTVSSHRTYMGCVCFIFRPYPTSAGACCMSQAKFIHYSGLVFLKYTGPRHHPSGAAADHVIAGVCFHCASCRTNSSNIPECPLDVGGVQFEPELPQVLPTHLLMRHHVCGLCTRCFAINMLINLMQSQKSNENRHTHTSDEVRLLINVS